LLEEQLDLALRIGKLGDSSLIARPLGHIGLVACAAPAFVRARGREAIERWDRIVVAEPARVEDQSGRTIRVSTFSEAAALAEAELGWTVLPSYTAVPALEREGLIVIKGAPERKPAPLHGLFAARHRNATDPIGLLLRELCEDVTQQLAGVEAKLARLRGRRRKS
jgi:DNA-binding transcriptional LysR family regulator